MPKVLLEVSELNSRTPRVRIQRMSIDKRILQEMVIGASGIKWKGVARLLTWTKIIALSKEIETGKAPRKNRQKKSVKAISVMLGGALKRRRLGITYIASWHDMKKGAQHPTDIVFTIGVTEERVHFGRECKDVDKTEGIPWDGVGDRIREKIRQQKHGTKYASNLRAR